MKLAQSQCLSILNCSITLTDTTNNIEMLHPSSHIISKSIHHPFSETFLLSYDLIQKIVTRINCTSQTTDSPNGDHAWTGAMKRTCSENFNTQMFSFWRCFTSTETIRIIRDGEPRTATSTFTLLLSSDTSVGQIRSLISTGEQKGWWWWWWLWRPFPHMYLD